MKTLALCLSVWMILFMHTQEAVAWEGETSNGDVVEIETGTYLRKGVEIEYYNDTTGEDLEALVKDVTNYGDTVVIEVFDYETAEYIELEMDEY